MVAQTVADSISVGVPRDQIKALRAVRESEGQFVTISDSEILSAISLLTRKVGVFAEPAGAAAFAGLKKMAVSGICGENDRVVVMVTGNGLKDVDGAMKAVKQEPLVVENSLEDVERKLDVFKDKGNK